MNKSTIIIAISVTAVLSLVISLLIINTLLNVQKEPETPQVETPVISDGTEPVEEVPIEDEHESSTEVTETMEKVRKKELENGTLLTEEELYSELEKYESYYLKNSVLNEMTGWEMDCYSGLLNGDEYNIFVSHTENGLLLETVKIPKIEEPVDDTGYEDWDSVPVGR